MFAVGGVLLLVQLAAQQWPALFPRPAVLFDYLQVVAMLLIVLLWGFGFGLVSRRFEWQADLFGARSVTPPADRCSQPCLLHGTADVPHSIEPAAQARDGLESAAPPGDALESTAHASVHRGLPLLTKGEPGGGDPPAGSAHNSLTVFPVSGEAARHSPLCATAAAIFADSLERIAVLNGIPAEARSWRHSSIANRMQLLDDYARDARLSARLERSVLIIKGVLVLGTLIGCIASVWIYWPS